MISRTFSRLDTTHCCMWTHLTLQMGIVLSVSFALCFADSLQLRQRLRRLRKAEEVLSINSSMGCCYQELNFATQIWRVLSII